MAATLWLLLGTATACPGYSSGPGKDSTLALWPPAHRGLPVAQGMRGEGGEQGARTDCRTVAAKPPWFPYIHTGPFPAGCFRGYCPHLVTFLLYCPDACLLQEACLDIFP